MRFLRRRKLRRVVALLLLIVFLQPLFAPLYTYALTTGPHQPEYTSYESPGATDMVNLMTGDFSFSLPILEVPGPEGSFSLPLAYNAGIGLDQESSWVGLGWTMNVGAITRSINEFPDDAAGESQSVTVQDLTGVRGWTSSLLGLGSIGWNTQVGHYGSISLLGIVSYNYSDSGPNSLGIAGVNVSSSGVTFDAVQFATAVMTIASYGAAAAGTSGMQTVTAIAKEAAIGIGVGAVTSLAFSSQTPNSPTAGYWKYSKKTQQRLFHKNYWIWLDQTRREDMYGVLYLGQVNSKLTQVANSSSDNYMDMLMKIGGVSENLYQFPKTIGANQGAASDINYIAGSNYYLNNQPASLATDNFSVKAMGISGAITPYRLDIGSVSTPREMTKYHTRYAPVKYKNDYKVPFVYDGGISNAYYHHLGGASAVSAPAPPPFHSGINLQVANTTPTSNVSLTFDLNDIIFKTQRINSAVSTTNKIPQAAHVEWMSNEEIKNSDTYTNGYMDFLSRQHASGATSSDRYKFRSNFTMGSNISPSSAYGSTSNFTATTSATVTLNSNSGIQAGSTITMNVTWYPDIPSWEAGNGGVYTSFTTTVNSVNTGNSITVAFVSSMAPFMNKPAEIEVRFYATPQIQKAIGGYAITAPDGTTFHFALPVYDYDLYTEMKDATDNNKKSLITRSAAFANSWLLTAITGPDFVDRNTNGLADDSDWGYWVKFNYGKYQDDYNWRLPYQDYKPSFDNAFDSYTSGKKQVYYLNTIETRSHVALFQKGTRFDSRSAAPTPQTSLKLDEIALLTKEHYKKLVTMGLPEFSNTINTICYSSLNSTLRTFINNQCLKRIVFTYTYDLCKNTPNSIIDATANPNKGKLTLTRVSIKGKNDVKLVPDYKFEYTNNPNYNKDHWDGWGFYNPNGTYNGLTHEASTTDSHGSAWSLTKIINPLGSEILVSYERDSYASISGANLYGASMSFNNGGNNYGAGQFNTLPVNHGATFQVGDRVGISGTLVYQCYGSTSTLEKIISVPDIQITATTTTSISFASNFVTFPECTQSGPILFTGYYGTVSKIINSKKGGDIRVASLTMKDAMGTETKMRYLYTHDNGSSSGVVAKEPEYIKGYEPIFHNYPGYPMTPVIYGKVSVLNGKLTSDTDYHTKQVYEFETPNQAMVTLNTTIVKSKTLAFQKTNPITFKEYMEAYRHDVVNRTSKIGSLKSIKIYNNTLPTPVSESQMIYTDQIKNAGGVNNYQGIYSDGVIMAEMVENKFNERYNKLSRTTIINYPWTLEKVVNTKDGFSSESKNLAWDFISGSVLEKLDKSSLGLYVKTVTKPAYLVPSYAEMGSKAVNINYKNMLSQEGAMYVYKSDANGSNLRLISASAQTWKKTWNNYRVYSTSTQTYSNGTEGPEVWRKGATYTWKGTYARRQADGTHTFSPSDEFNFTTPQSTWQYLGEPTLFDHFSMPLESRNHDIANPIHSASKMGYDNRIKIAEASNAKFQEIAFSSAEDKIATIPFFGGEVGLGSGTVVSTPVHTGKRALSVPSSTYGFIYKGTELTANKKYRASVWASSTNGRIYYKINGGAEMLSLAPTTATKAGNWYRIDIPIIDMGANTTIEVGVKSASGTVVFDDFRFQPLDAVMTCYVYDPLDFEYDADFKTNTFVLDNDNFYTRFEEEANGLLSKVYRESFKYSAGTNGERLVSENKSDYRRFYINQ